MKIALNMGGNVDTTGSAAQDKALERDILAARGGDWTAKQNLARTFHPLIVSLAKKRTGDSEKMAVCIEAGGEGLVKAAKRYRQADGPHKFRILAAAAIEEAMDRAANPSFIARLFGRG